MKPPKILIIAEKTKATLRKNLLERLGYERVELSPSLDQSFAWVEKKKPDVVILESGVAKAEQTIQIGEEIRSRFNVPVLYLVSAKSQSFLKPLRLRERFDYLTVPLKDHELYFAVETALTKRSSAQPGRKQESKSPSVEDYFEQFLALAPIAFIVTDKNGVICFANVNTEELFGYAKEELIGKNFGMLIPERYRPIYEKNKKRYLDQLKNRVMSPQLDISCRRSDGVEVPVEIGLNPVTLQGKIYVTLSVVDITGRKKSEEDLRKAETQYRTLVEQIPAIVYIASLKQHIGVTYISPRIKALGFDQEEWVSDPELWFRQVHTEDQPKVLADIEKSRKSGKPFRSEYRLITRAGEARWFIDEAMNVVDKDGELLFRQGFMLDITERKNAEGSLASRERYLALLNDMTRAILLAKDVDATLNILAAGMVRLVNADDCYILRWDDERRKPIPVTATAELGFPFSEAAISENETGITASVLRAGHVLTIEDVHNSPYIDSGTAHHFPARSVIGIPLIVGPHKLGAAIIAFNTPHHFTLDEIERAEHAGDQVAIALWNYQQSAEIQQRLKQSHTLTVIGRTLSEIEQVGSERVLQLIVDSALDLVSQAEQSVIHIIDIEANILRPMAIAGFTNVKSDALQLKMQIGAGVAGQVIKDGITINIPDVEKDPRFLRPDKKPAFRSLIVAPIQSGRQQIGTISIQSKNTSAFSKEDEELLNALAINAAIAIDNTRSFELTQQRLKEVNALYGTIKVLAASLDPQELVSDVVALLQKNFGFYYVQLFLIDPLNNDLVLKSGSGEVGRRLLDDQRRLERGTGIIGHVAETGAPFVTNNVNDIVFFKRHPLLPDTQFELAVPIKIGQDVVGVLDVQDKPPRRLTHGDLQLVTAVADQLAVALQKATLFTDLQHTMKQEQAIRSQLLQSERLALVGRLLASVSHELNNPLQAIQNALFLLKEESGLSAQGHQDLGIVLSETERMAALIERLRSAYRPLRGKDFQPVQLNSLIEDVFALIGTHMRHKDIAFEFIPDPDLEYVSGISDQLRQVVLNLFLNAIEVMRPGGRLTVQTRNLIEQNEVYFSVKDSGPGIEAEILPHIFDAFITSKHTGTGLGLTITHDILEQHRGRISADNDPEGGAIFHVWLPMCELELK